MVQSEAWSTVPCGWVKPRPVTCGQQWRPGVDGAVVACVAAARKYTGASLVGLWASKGFTHTRLGVCAHEPHSVMRASCALFFARCGSFPAGGHQWLAATGSSLCHRTAHASGLRRTDVPNPSHPHQHQVCIQCSSSPLLTCPRKHGWLPSFRSASARHTWSAYRTLHSAAHAVCRNLSLTFCRTRRFLAQTPASPTGPGVQAHRATQPATHNPAPPPLRRHHRHRTNGHTAGHAEADTCH